jgi:RHS repeat-associated protein
VSQLIAIGDPDSRYAYTYDLAGRLTSVDNTGTPNAPSVVLGYTYDAVNNRLSKTDTINGQLKGTETYLYDALDRVTRITQSGNGVSEKRVDLTYDAASQMTGIARYSDLLGTLSVANSDYSYDLAGRLTRLTHKRNSTTYADYQWTYDGANRITQFISPDGTSNYNYDNRDQLTGTDHSYQSDEAYGYDANGNRINAGYQTGTNNQLLSDGTYTYAYDNEGNRTSRTNIATGEVTEYAWDYHNRLIGVVTKDSTEAVVKTVAYTYDAYDRRIAKVIDVDGSGPAMSVTERMIYDEDNIALTFDGQGVQTHRYLYGPGIDQVLADETQTSVNWALVDNQGTVRAVIDNNGIVLNHISYDSFGNVTSETNPNVDLRYGYTGRELDQETGLDYYRARYYDPTNGRFISKDPIGFNAGDTNLYRYVGNNPINFSDPSGLQQCDCAKPPYIPFSPPNAPLYTNIEEARQHDNFPFNVWWFKGKVENGKAWDYKQLDPGREADKSTGTPAHKSNYEDFGNFHYGVVGRAANIPGAVLEREAGRAQGRDGTTDKSFGDPGIQGDIFGVTGSGTYGDAAEDNYWIKKGIAYYDNYYNKCYPKKNSFQKGLDEIKNPASWKWRLW